MDDNKDYNQAIVATSRSMMQGLGMFILINPHLELAAETTGTLKNDTLKLERLIRRYFELDSVTDLEPSVVRADLDISTDLQKLKKGAFDLTALAFIIPFLLNKEAREYFASFLQGLTGIENLDALKKSLLGVAALIGGFFAYKFISQISTALSSMVKLSAAVAALFGLTRLTQPEPADLELPEAEKEQRKPPVAGGGPLTPADKEKKERRERREKKLQKLKKYRAGINALTAAGRWAGPIALVATLVNATASTVLDIAEKEDEDWDPAEAITTFTKNVIESATFGLISKTTIENTKKVITGSTDTKKQNLQAISGMSVYGAEFSGFESPPAISDTLLTEKPTTVPNARANVGIQILSTSEKVSSAKKQANVTPMVNVTNIDNSTIMVDNSSDYSGGFDAFFVSSSVGK